MEDQNDLEIAVAKLKEESELYLNSWKRAKADYANLERQVERQREDWAHFANVNCIQAFLPVYESLVQAAMRESADEGLIRIRDQMQGALKSLGVEVMETMGKMPDPMLHEVIGRDTKDDVESGAIIQEVQQGFMIHGKVLRVAKVIIAE